MRALALLLLLLASPAIADQPERWAVYYGSALPVEDFAPFDTLVFDAEEHPPIEPLKAQGKTVLGYLSLGEAESYRPYYKELKQKKLLLAANPQWKGHYIIDIRKPGWREMVNEKLIPELLAKGFDGVMFDTIDSPLHLENENPKRYPGMHDAAVELLHAVRIRHPQLKIMLNRGFEILERAAIDIDMSLAESTRADILPKEKTARLTPQADYEMHVATLKAAKDVWPALKIYTLDYWNMDDGKGIDHIYAEQRRHGFIPYVATLDLQRVFGERR